MPHSFLFGHLLTIGKVVMKAKFPPDSHSHWNILLVKEAFPELSSAGLLYVGVPYLG